MISLGAKYDTRHGNLQLTAGPETKVEPLHIEPSHHQLIRSGYKKRYPKSLTRINIMSRKICLNLSSNEVDVAACVVKISKIGNNKTVAYLTDESGLVLKLVRDHKEHIVDPFFLGNENTWPMVAAFCDIQVVSFDALEQCAIASFGLSTSKTNRLMQPRCDELLVWCKSPLGIDQCGHVLDRIDASIPTFIEPLSSKKVCIGYILRFEYHEARTDETSSSEIYVIVDYGDEYPIKASISRKLILGAFELSLRCFQSGVLVDSCPTTVEHINVASMGGYFQDRQTLFHFSLEEKTCYEGNSSMLEVIKISLAETDSITRMHM